MSQPQPELIRSLAMDNISAYCGTVGVSVASELNEAQLQAMAELIARAAWQDGYSSGQEDADGL